MQVKSWFARFSIVLILIHLSWTVKKRNRHIFQYRVITFSYCLMAAVIAFFHSAQVEESNYVIVYVLTLYPFPKDVWISLTAARNEWKTRRYISSSSNLDRWFKLWPFSHCCYQFATWCQITNWCSFRR